MLMIGEGDHAALVTNVTYEASLAATTFEDGGGATNLATNLWFP